MPQNPTNLVNIQPVYGNIFDVVTGRLVEVPDATTAGRAG